MLKNTNNDRPKLPWWVEFLFVQIGLPDNWLRIFLKSRKKTRLLIKENKKSLTLLLTFCFSIIYMYPIIKHYSNHNKCIRMGSNLVRQKFTNEELSKVDILVFSTHYCNGGSLK